VLGQLRCIKDEKGGVRCACASGCVRPLC
jgi:hypothetical protein